MSVKMGPRSRKAALLMIAALGIVMGFQNCTASDSWKKQLAGESQASSIVAAPAPLPTPTVTGTVELITDPMMKTGFQETDACPNVSPSVTASSCATPAQRNVPNGLYPDYAGQAPKWTLTQWGSRTSLYGGGGYTYGNGLVWSVSEKHIAVFPGGIFEMGVNGYQDWLGQYRQTQPARPAWPSFTLGFTIANVGDPSKSPGGSVSGMNALNFAIDAYLSAEDRHQQTGYDPNQNTVIFVAFISIINLIPTSADYGHYVWMGIPIYNDLERSPSAYVNADSFGNGLGTGMLIYNPGYSVFSSNSLWNAQWTHLGADMLPHVKTAITTAISKGLLKDGDLTHYFVGGFTIGYEVTGLNETTIQFKNPSIQVSR